MGPLSLTAAIVAGTFVAALSFDMGVNALQDWYRVVYQDAFWAAHPVDSPALHDLAREEREIDRLMRAQDFVTMRDAVTSLLRCGLLGILLLLTWSATAQPILLVQDDLADLRAGDVTGQDWLAVPRGELRARFCAAAPDASARLMLLSRPLNRRERDACFLGAGGRLVETLIGRRAVLAMTAGPAFGVTPELLYRALAREVPYGGVRVPNAATRWRELDENLPDAPIRVLLPLAGSIEDRIVTDIILYDGCSSAGSAPLPADPIRRMDICTTRRADAAVAQSDGRQVAAWLRGQGAGAVALIGIATLLAEPELERALPLDGVVPGFPVIAEGRYRAALPVYLVTVVAQATARDIAAVAGPLLAETSIGPLGKLPRRGLAPLSAAERVKLRASLGALLENATN